MGVFLGGSVVQNPPANAGDIGSVHPSVRKTPWRRKWQPSPVFLPGNPTDRRAWRLHEVRVGHYLATNNNKRYHEALLCN